MIAEKRFVSRSPVHRVRTVSSVRVGACGSDEATTIATDDDWDAVDADADGVIEFECGTVTILSCSVMRPRPSWFAPSATAAWISS